MIITAGVKNAARINCISLFWKRKFSFMEMEMDLLGNGNGFVGKDYCGISKMIRNDL